MLNAEKYKKDIEKANYCFAIANNEFINCFKLQTCTDCKFDKTHNCGMERLKWLLQEYKEPILDDIEKEYLSAVIKPFRKRIKSIKKTGYPSNSAFISIAMDKYENIFLPVFELNSGMYQRMEINKEYTLEDLGL